MSAFVWERIYDSEHVALALFTEMRWHQNKDDKSTIVNMVGRRECDVFTSVSDAGDADGATRSFRWFRLHVSKSTRCWQSECRLSLQFAGRVSTSRQGRALVDRRCARRLQAGHGAATTAETTRKSLWSFGRVTSSSRRVLCSRVSPINPSTTTVNKHLTL